MPNERLAIGPPLLGRVFEEAIADDAWELLIKGGPPYGTPGKRGEDLFNLILSGIKEVYEIDAFVAGGAVRDLVAGCLDHKDVDVFIPLKPEEFFELSDQLGWRGVVRLSRNTKYGKKTDQETFSSIGRAAANVQGCAVDLVFLEKPLSPEEVRRFPVYAQRCVWSLNNGTTLTPEAEEDINNKRFTIDPSIENKDEINKLLEKVSGWKKRDFYKDWTINSPELKEWWEKRERDLEKVMRDLHTKVDNPMLYNYEVKIFD